MILDSVIIVCEAYNPLIAKADILNCVLLKALFS